MFLRHVTGFVQMGHIYASQIRSQFDGRVEKREVQTRAGTNMIRIANTGWRIQICIREYTFQYYYY